MTGVVRPTFFGELAMQILNGGTRYDHTHILPEDYPFTILGWDTWRVTGKRLGMPKAPLELVSAGARLQLLGLSLRLLTAECEVFLVQRGLHP